MSVISLSADALRREMADSDFDFRDTSQLEPSRELIGQKRAVEALDFGLKINIDGYNIYMSGESGEGKTRYALESSHKAARTMPIPDDWILVHNFEEADQPRVLNLPHGTGKQFKKDMDDFVRVLEQEIVKAFDGEDYQAERARIIRQFKDKKDNLVLLLDVAATEKDFKVRVAVSGIWFLPIVDGTPIDEDTFKELDEGLKSGLTKKMEALQKECANTIRKIREVELEAEEAVREWEGRIALYALGIHMDDLREKYSERANIQFYLEQVRADILKNIEALRSENSPDDQQAVFMQMMMRRGQEEGPRQRYRVNLLIDNSRLHGAPVIMDHNPTYQNLMGRCEYDNEAGAMTTDFMKIKPGLFHQANGGFLILQMNDLLVNPQAFEAIKRTLKTRLITIEPMKEQMNLPGLVTIRPEPIPLNVKVILVGNSDIHQLLFSMDRDFRKFFKIKADFDDEMPWTEENTFRIAQFIAAWCGREGMRHFDRQGVAAVISHCSRLVQNQDRLTTRFNDIAALLAEATAWADICGDSLVSSIHVKKAVHEQQKRSGQYYEKLREMYFDGTLMVDTDGWVVGQINGLAVLDMGDSVFGKVTRITAATYMGKNGIVDIEREVDFGGGTHSKGVLILNGYIGKRFAQESPLSLTASICFEQLYSGVEGDSASSAELYAILSSLAELPIFQGIAVTGSVNQHGMIQPVGGITQKVEGFFDLCTSRGLNGKQGVIIPCQNVKNLVVSDAVVEAVNAGLFHIWPISRVDEGIHILTGVPAGEKQGDGSWTMDSVNERVHAKLKKFADIVSRFQSPGKAYMEGNAL